MPLTPLKLEKKVFGFPSPQLVPALHTGNMRLQGGHGDGEGPGRSRVEVFWLVYLVAPCMFWQAGRLFERYNCQEQGVKSYRGRFSVD